MTAPANAAPGAWLHRSLPLGASNGILGLVALATLAAAVLGGDNPLLALVPVLLATLGYLAANAPLRASAAVLLLVLLGAEDHGDITLQWRSPLALIGDLLHFRLDRVAGIPGLTVTGMEVVLAALFAVWLGRRLSPTQIDGPQDAPPASVLGLAAALYVGGVLLAEVIGLARGLPVAPWKLRNLLQPLALAALFVVAFRSERDRLLVGRLLVAATLLKAFQAVLVQRFAIADTGGPLAHATSHGDSVLFALAMFLLVVDVAVRPHKRRLLRALLLLPPLAVGAIENDRRILWAMLGLMVLTWYVISPMQGWKRTLTRAVVVTLPIIALYVGVGWGRGGAIFAPVRILRGFTDTSQDRSAYWREVENWNIAMTMRERPVLGVGLGGEYTEFMPNDDVSAGFKEYREWPHNAVLGQLLLLGLFGFTAVWILPALAIFLAVRSARLAATAEQRVSALGCLGAVVACQVLAWGDTGAHFPQYKIILGVAVAVVVRLAVEVGAWPARQRAA